MSSNLKIGSHTLNVHSLDFIMLSPNYFSTVVHTGNRYFTTKFYHDGPFIITNHNPVEGKHKKENTISKLPGDMDNLS